MYLIQQIVIAFAYQKQLLVVKVVSKLIYENDGGYDCVLPRLLIYFNQKTNKQKEGNARQKGLPRNCELQNTSWLTKNYG